MNAQKLLYIISQAPYSNSSGQEALEAILIGASFEKNVSVLFLHDGVFQLKSPQPEKSPQPKESPQQEESPQRIKSPQPLKSPQPKKSSLNLKAYTKTFKALSDFGVDECFVLANSLEARGLSTSELMIEPAVLNEQQVSELIAAQNRVFTF